MTNSLGKRLVGYMAEATFLRSAEAGLANAKKNLPYIERTITELNAKQTGQVPDIAMVISAGPSLHRKDPAKLLLKYQYDGPDTVSATVWYPITWWWWILTKAGWCVGLATTCWKTVRMMSTSTVKS